MDIALQPFGRPLAPAALLARAEALAARQPALAGALKGKNIGLVSAAADSREARLFSAAAAGLGAKVAHVRAALSESSPAPAVAETARLLGRLYDAIECQGMSEALLQLIRREAGIPVFDGIAGAQHWSAALTASLDPALPEERRRMLLIQAQLLEAAI
ncbi:ornithine carbamoyltransferase [Roseateles violae]|uniref:Ornithine carbamoyltransferase n=1 Tax=Roseateles violae TaxID=3058042 RepID=A0ABT8DPU2_9BURK|nr:ornithine carbamoyltransferase [Pelomonas sp. PFR6]MDN3920360.1 ornithine carbamoyltransferase [Pelomonas sp. PFR6]